MNARSSFTSIALLASLALSVSGCVCGPVASGGDATFLWKFGGRTCAMLPDISTVTIRVPGQTLMNQGVFPCTTGGSDGIKLLNFRGGTYTFTMQAKNASGAALYESSGSFTVNGNVETSVDMTVVANAPAYAYLTWSLPPNGAFSNPTCAQAGVSLMYITLNGQSMGAAVNCSEGQTANGLLLNNLTAGTYTIDLAAADMAGNNAFYYYRKTSTLTGVPGVSAASYALEWYAGGTAFKWSFPQGKTCADLGLLKINIDLRNSEDVYVYGGTYKQVDCLKGGTQGVYLPDTQAGLQYLYPDTYRVYAVAQSGNTNYTTNFTTPPTVQVRSGIFPTLDVNSPVITLTQSP